MSARTRSPRDVELAGALADASAVLFLCTGNMVRSAFAEGYARHLGCARPVSSAATRFRNDHLLPETARALHARGVAAEWTRSFRPRHVADVRAELDERTLVLAMARMHFEPMHARPELSRRTFLLSALLGEEDEIPDPVLDGASFAETFERVARCVEALVARLR